MAEWADVYKNIKPAADPLATAGAVYGIANAEQQLELAKQAERVRQFEVDKAQADDLRSSVGPLANVPGVSRAEVLATMAQRAKQLGIHPRIYQQAAEPFSDPGMGGEALQKALNIQAVGAAGAPSLTQRQQVTGPQGETTSEPAPKYYGKPAASGIGPAATAAASTYGTQAGAVLGGEAANQTDYRRQVTPLEQAIPALERLGTTGTGPLTDEINKMKSVAVSFGFAPKNWTGSVKDFDEANKYLTDWVRSNGDTTTNDKLAASFSSNASTKISNAAAQDVAKTALAIRRMKYLQLQEFYAKQAIDPNLTPDKFPQWASRWNATHDPRAFGWDQYTVDQRNKILKSIPTRAKQDLFKFDVQAADDAGVLTRQPE